MTRIKLLAIALALAALPAGVALAASSPGVTTRGAFPVLPADAYLPRYVNPHASPTTDHTFKTERGVPTVATGAATHITTTGATLTGSVNPGGRPTAWSFEWGRSTRYGEQSAVQRVPGSTSEQLVQDSLQGLLAPGTVYHYRLVAQNALGIDHGADSSFMTYPVHRPTPGVSARTNPSHAPKRPYTFNTSGKVARPSSIPAKYACAGTVTIRFFRGSRQVAYRATKVSTECKFSARTVFRQLPGQRRPVRLRVVIRFLATPYLAGNRAPGEHVILG